MAAPEDYFVINDKGVLTGLTALGKTQTSLTIPSSVTSIDMYAFYEDTLLERVVWNEGIERIKGKVFNGCTSLKSISIAGKEVVDNKAVIPYTVERGDQNGCLFENCDLLTTIEFEAAPEGETSIVPANMLRGCNKVKKVIIPSSVKSIGDAACYRCSELERVVWNEGLEKIEKYAFADAPKIKSFALGDKEEEGTIFYPSTLIRTEAPIFSLDTVNNDNLIKAVFVKAPDGKASIVPAGSIAVTKVREVYLSESVVEIETLGLAKADYLKKVVWTEGLTKIDASAFGDKNNSVLDTIGISGNCVPKKVVIPSTVTFISADGNNFNSDGVISPFKYLTSIDTMEFNEAKSGETSIVPAYVASNATNIKNVILADSLVAIDPFAFNNCGISGKFTLSKNIKKIGRSAFNNVSGVTEIQTSDVLETIEANAFANNNSNLTSIIWNDKLTSIDNTIFTNTNNVNKIGVKEAGKEGVVVIPSGLTTVTVANTYSTASPFASLTKINKMVFSEAKNGNSIVPANIGNKAEFITSVEFADSNSEIEKNAFEESGLTGEVVLGDNIKVIGPNSFKKCQKVTSFVLPSKLEKICEYAFAECEKISAITIPTGTKEIDKKAFENDFMLDKVIWGEGLVQIDSTIFDGIDSIKTIGTIDECEEGTVIIPSSLELITYNGSKDNNSVSPFIKLLNINKMIFADSDISSDTTVPAYIAYEAKNIISADFSESITSIGKYAFCNSGISGKINLPTRLKTIDDYAFYGCQNIESITIRDQVEHIGEYAFDTYNSNILYRVYKDSYAHRFLENKGVKNFEFLPITIREVDIAQNLKLHVEETTTLKYSTVPEEALADRDSWTSSNANVVILYGIDGKKEAVVKGVGAGKATLTLKVDGIIAKTKVEVSDEITLDYGYKVDDIEKCENVKASFGSPIEALSVSPEREGYVFLGWFTSPEGKGTKYSEDTPLTSNVWKLYAYWQQIEEGKLYIAPIGEYEYTGKAIKPAITVYDGSKKLVLNQDYTIKGFSNNVNAGEAIVTIAGKGNYSGTETAGFTINKISLSSNSIEVEDIYVLDNNNVQKPLPVVYFGKAKLKQNKDYVVSYPNTEANAYKAEGTYVIRITGTANGNFSESKDIKLKIAPKSSQLINKMKFDKIPNQTYNNGNPIKPVVKGKNSKKETLVENKDYVVGYENNTEIGTAKVIITGRGEYIGRLVLNFKIVGVNISKAKFDPSKLDKTGAILKPNGSVESYSYTGSEIKPAEAVDSALLYIPKTSKTPQINLRKDVDYKVKYQKNINSGTASIIFTGINGYSGSVKKTFKISPYNPGTSPEKNKISANSADSVIYSKGGAKPEVSVMFNNKVLQLGKDYTVSYVNNNKNYSDTSFATANAPTVVVKGKGNFAGTLFEKHFTISKKSLKSLSVNCADKLIKPNSAKYNSTTVKIFDTDKKALNINKDFTVTAYKYNKVTVVTQKGKAGVIIRAIGENVDPEDIIPESGTEIKVEVAAVENSPYTDSTYGIFRATSKSLASVKVNKINMNYTGKEVLLTKNTSQGEVACDELANAVYTKINGENKTLVYGTDYKIVPGSYEKNVNRGTAKVTLVGIGEYSGTKVISFTIGAKAIKK